MRIKLERAILIALLVYNYLSAVLSFRNEDAMGIAALVGAGVIVWIMIALLIRSSAGAALMLAAFQVIRIIGEVLEMTVFIPKLAPGFSLSVLSECVWFAIGLIALYCEIDLWARWRRRPV